MCANHLTVTLPMSTQSRKFLQSYAEHFGISESPLPGASTSSAA